MPGRLMAEHDTAIVDQATEKSSKIGRPDTSPSLANGVSYHHASPHTTPPPAPQRPSNILSNGISQQKPEPSKSAMPPTSQSEDPPPEIAHITQGFQPLSRLFGRVSQECFNDLNDLITDLADLPHQPHVNGVTPSNTSGNTSQTNIERKLRWLHFANTQREKFIKLLVILQWSKKTEEVGKLIDVGAWAVSQDARYKDVSNSMGELVRRFSTSKIRAPDVEIALETLTTGASTLLPDFGYIPLPSLTPQKLLRTIRNVNVLLQVRLNLHDDLPEHLRNYSIASGRVTFAVPDEFEVDLSIADEDPTSQLYFIGFRLLFSSNLEIPVGAFYHHFESHVNDILKTQGLAACYEYLHDFVLTHKINILRKKALDLSRTTWTGSLQIEQIHRSLIIRYWTRRTGPKNWIEIGVKKGKHGRRKEPAVASLTEHSHLGLKWMRGGKEIAGLDMSIDSRELNVEDILNGIIARHISFILSSLHDEATASGLLTTSLHTSDTRPHQCRLEMLRSQMPAPSRQGCVMIEPTSGGLVLQPITATSLELSANLNKLSSLQHECFPGLRHWCAAETKIAVETNLQPFGWKVLTPTIEFRRVRYWLGDAVLAVTFLQHAEWSTTSPWTVAIATSGNDQKWAALKLLSQDGMCQIETMYEVPSPKKIDYPMLEAEVSRCIGLRCLMDRMDSMLIPHVEKRPRSQTRAMIDMDPTLLPLGTRVSASYKSQLAKNAILIDVVGRSGLTSSDMQYVVIGEFSRGSMLFNILSNIKLPDIRMSREGIFRIWMRVPLGDSIIFDYIVYRLKSLEVLGNLINVLRHRGLPYEEVSEAGFIFRYGRKMEDGRVPYLVRLAFEDGARLRTSLESLQPQMTNPQHCIEPHLSNLLNTGDDHPVSSFPKFISILLLTLPVCQVLQQISGSYNPCEPELCVFTVRNASHFVLRYPRHRRDFVVRLQVRRNKDYWDVELCRPSQTSADAGLDAALKHFFKTSGEGRHGLGTATAFEEDKIEDGLMQLHGIMKSHSETSTSVEKLFNDWTTSNVAGAAISKTAQPAMSGSTPRIVTQAQRVTQQPPTSAPKAVPGNKANTSEAPSAPVKPASQQPQPQPQAQQPPISQPPASKMQKQPSQQGAKPQQPNGNANGSNSNNNNNNNKKPKNESEVVVLD
ncbi:MAG: mediator complex subunit [Chrysothrix sp. TS-e1954]|nr:MAG: mediator complex subunit [Chrysothrix sp. TS-e1954]